MRIKRLDFVIISSIDWDFLWQRHQAFALGLAQKGARVFFIENTGFRKVKLKDFNRILTRIKNFISGAATKHINLVPKNIKIISPILLPPVGKVNIFLNRYVLIPFLIKKLKKYNLVKDLVIITYLPTPTSVEIIKKMEPRVLIYDCVDNFEGHPDVPKNYKTTERELLNLTNLVLTASDFLYEKHKKIHNNVEQIHHGVNFDLFRKADSEIIDRKKVCYFGAINQRLDWEIIRNIVSAGYKVFLYGVNLSKRNSSNNIFIEGPFSQRVLIDRIRDCAAIILPYRTDTDWMKGVLPAKIYECLATGKPVLSSDLPNYSVDLKQLLYICKKPWEFVEILDGLEQLENKEKKQKRINYAKRYSSDMQIEKLTDLILKYAAKK